MIYVKNILCSICGTEATYGDPVTREPEFCQTHMLPGMVDVRHINCLLCDSRPSFNYGTSPETKTPIYCAKHKLDGMVNTNNNQCEKCERMPSFGYPGTKHAFRCAHHLTDEQGAKLGLVNLISSKCRICGRTASHAIVGTKKQIYCGTCALTITDVQLVDLKHKSRNERSSITS